MIGSISLSANQSANRFGVNMTYKITTTDTHVFFLTGPFSQWHPSTFTSKIFNDGPEYTFNCAEQYMMAAKAMVFQDIASFDAIMAEQYDPNRDEYFSRIPSRQKALGRSVKNFSPDVWDAVSRDFVYKGNVQKFLQNPDMLQILLDTGARLLVEGSRNDRIWGVGLAWDDPAILDPKNWLGTNWLGQTLTRVRNTILTMGQ